MISVIVVVAKNEVDHLSESARWTHMHYKGIQGTTVESMVAMEASGTGSSSHISWSEYHIKSVGSIFILNRPIPLKGSH
jgi:hypothetical protein